MKKGRIEQVGNPTDLYDDPSNEFVFSLEDVAVTQANFSDPRALRRSREVLDGSRHPPRESGNTGPWPCSATLRRRSIARAKAGSRSRSAPAAALGALAEQPAAGVSFDKPAVGRCPACVAVVTGPPGRRGNGGRHAGGRRLGSWRALTSVLMGASGARRRARAAAPRTESVLAGLSPEEAAAVGQAAAPDGTAGHIHRPLYSGRRSASSTPPDADACRFGADLRLAERLHVLVSRRRGRRAGGEVLFGLAEDLAGDRSGFALAEQHEAHEVGEWVALGPLEVQVRTDSRLVPDAEHDRGEGVGYGRAVRAQHAVTVDLDAVDVEFLGEVGRVGHVDLEEDDRAAVGDRVESALFEFLVPVLGEVAGLAFVRDHVQLAPDRSQPAMNTAAVCRSRCRRRAVRWPGRAGRSGRSTTIPAMNAREMTMPSGFSMTFSISA